MQEKFSLKSKSGNKLVCLIDRNEKLSKQGLVFIAGGFGSFKGSEKQESLAKLFMSFGYAVMRMDFSGVGESEGDLSHSTISVGLDDYNSAMEYIFSQNWVNRENIGVYGNSYGGCLTNLYASENDVFKFIIFAAPCIDYLELYKKLDIDAWKKDGFLRIVNARRSYDLYEDALKYSPYEKTSNIKSKSLIIHSLDDEIVPFSQSEKLSKLVGASKLVPLKGYNHMFVNGFADVLSEIYNWMKS